MMTACFVAFLAVIQVQITVGQIVLLGACEKQNVTVQSDFDVNKVRASLIQIRFLDVSARE